MILALGLGCGFVWGWQTSVDPEISAIGQAVRKTDRSADTPSDTVRRQLSALASISPDDPRPSDRAAMRRVYDLASPGNQRSIGTFEEFDRLVRSESYSPLIGNRAALIGREMMSDNLATVVATLMTHSGQPAAFEFHLCRVPAVDQQPVADQERMSDGTVTSVSSLWRTDAVYPQAIVSGGVASH